MADDIKKVGLELTAKGAEEFKRSLKEVASATKESYSELKLAQSQYDKNTSAVDKLKDRQKYLTDVTEQYAKKAQILEDQLKELESAENRDETAINKKKAEINNCNAKLNEYEKSLKDVNNQLSTHSAQLKEWGSKLQTVGDKITGIGEGLSAKVTAPLVGVGALGAAKFAEVDKTMQLTNKTMGNTEAEAQKLNQAMKDAASNSTFGMSDAATATLNFARAGLNAEQASSALAPAMNLAAGEGGNLDTVSGGLVATINSFHDSFDNAGKYADVFAAACNNSALDVDSLSGAMSVAAPIFSAAGYSVNDAALYMGVMANAGIDADKAANSLKTGLARLVDPPKAAAQMMDQLGLSVTNADGTMKDSTQVQQELHDAFSGLSESEQLAAASAIFGKNQMAPWLALINTAPEDVGALDESLANCAGTTNEMAESMMSGFGGSLERLKSSIDVLVTSVGEALAPTIQSVAEGIQGLVDKFNSLTPAQQETVVKIGAIVAAVGPLLVIIGTAISTIGSVVTAMGAVSGAIGTLTGGAGLASIGPALGGVLSAAAPFLIGGALVVGVIAAAALIIENWDKIKETAGELVENVKQKWTDFKNDTAQKWRDAKDKAAQAAEDLRQKAVEKFDSLKQSASEKWDSIKETVGNAAESLKNGASEKLQSLKDTAGGIFDALKGDADEKMGGATSIVTGAFDTMLRAVGFTWGLPDLNTDAVSSAYDTVSSAVNDMLDALGFEWSLPDIGTLSLDNAGSLVSDFIDDIMDSFDGIHLSLPDIQLPHLSVSWEDLGPISIPHISVDWYAKAYDNPYLFTSPTVVGAMGFGDRPGGGGEMVYGHDSLMRDIREAVGTQPRTFAPTINVYTREGQSSEEIAQDVMALLKHEYERQERVYA